MKDKGKPMLFETVTLADLRQDFEVIVERVAGDAAEWTATLLLVSCTGLGPASSVSIEIAVSSDSGEAKYICQPSFWGIRLPEFIPALHEALIEFSTMQTSS